MAKSNSTWIDVRAGLDDLILQEYHQPYEALMELPYSDKQSPQLVMLVGGAEKWKAMSSLRFGAATKPHGSRGEVRLLVDNKSTQATSPILFADCELHTGSAFNKILGGRVPGNITRRSLIWRKQMTCCVAPADLANLVYTKLLSPFSTVICLFADDLQGLDAVAKTLASWLVNLSSRPSDLPLSTHPQVMIFLNAEDPSHFNEVTATRDFRRCLSKEAERRSGHLVERVQGRLTKAKLDSVLSSHFGEMQVIALPTPSSSSRTWRDLRGRILEASDEVHMERRKSNVAFSTTHFRAFFHLACKHFCEDIVTPFNFIKASRIQNPVPSQLGMHVSNFIQKLEIPQVFQFAVPTIASALVLDSYPPGMHFFDPAQLFKQLYLHTCDNAPTRAGSVSEKAFDILQLTKAVEGKFCQTLDIIEQGKTSAAASHKEVLFRYRDYWTQLYSNVTCLACLARQPENTLSCGHSLCDPCIIIHGAASVENSWTLRIETCPLCNRSTGSVFKMKPPTAGVRVLSIDGGGVRGIMPITWLQLLEATLRLHLPVQEHFDVTIGTSSGGLVALGLSYNMWSVERCGTEFEGLAKSAFRSRMCWCFPFFWSDFLRKPREILFSFMTDSQYKTGGITKALQSAYGETQRLFGHQSSTKIAITATTTDKSSNVIFSNYNGPERSAECGYRNIRPEDNEKEMFVWEIARATSAAPLFFRSYRGFHDGGLGGHNNPVKLGIWEQDSIWNRKSKHPDVVLSLGTGSRIDNELIDEKPMSWISQLYLPRLVRSFMNLLDGQKTWVDLVNDIPQQFRPRYHRLNVSFQGPEPRIDDVDCMRDLAHLVRTHASSCPTDLLRCADNIIASLFYIELDCLPTFSQYTYICRGRILCRLDAETRALHALVVRLKEQQARFYLHAQDHITCVDKDTYERVQQGGRFQRSIEFEVSSLSEEIDFKVDGITQRARSISNCPYVVSDLITDQGLHCMFGRLDHKRRLEPLHRASKRRRYT